MSEMRSSLEQERAQAEAETIVLRDCEDVQAELSGYIDDEVSPSKRTAMAEHIAHCAACRAEVALLGLVTQSLRQAPRPEPSEAMHRRLMAQVAADGPPQRVEIVCTERHGDRVVQWREVRTTRDAPPRPRPSAELTPAMMVSIQQLRREQIQGPGIYQVIEDHYGRATR
jgi:putative zinc finger protein